MHIKLAFAGILAFSLTTPIAAQPEASKSAADARHSSELLEERRKTFAWLLGTWKGDHMFGSNSNRSGAQVTFYLEADGTVSARLDKMSPWMEDSEKRFADLVGKRFIRAINASNPTPSVWTNSASGGSVVDKYTGGWTNLGIIYVDSETGKLSHLGAMSDLSQWVKLSGGASQSQPSAAPNTRPRAGKDKRVESQRPVGPATSANPSNGKKCSYPMYQTLAVGSMTSVIATFENDVDEVATYDPDMPMERLFPNPIGGAADIPVKYMDFNDYRALTRIEEITTEIVTESGPDEALNSAAKDIQRLYKEARQSYDLSARLADQRRNTCPKFSDPDAYPKIAAAGAILDKLRKRRDEVLKPRLAEGERLNEKLSKAFFGDLADASSLDEEQKKAFADLQEKAFLELKGFLTRKAIEPQKVQDLVPQLEALRTRYGTLQSEGKSVSQEAREKDLKEALKRSGIKYDPSLARTAKRGGQISMGKSMFDYVVSTIGPQPTGIGKLLSTTQSFIGALTVTAEALNALKNYYMLMRTRDELMPVALTVQENRAYLAGLVKRYDILEQEYAIMRKNFENAVTSGGALSETD